MSSVDSAARARLKELLPPSVWSAIESLPTDRIKAVAVTSGRLTQAQADILGMDPQVAKAMGLITPAVEDNACVHYLPTPGLNAR